MAAVIKKPDKEIVAKGVFVALAAFSVIAVFTIVGYLLAASIPAFRLTGVIKFVFGSEWSGKNEVFGIWRMIAGTFVLTACATAVGGSLAILTAMWLTFYCPKKLKKFYTQIINLLAGIPSIVYGLFGYKFLMPALVGVFHPANAGFGLLACTIILSVMILPTVASVTKNSLESVPMHYYEGALSLGCSKNQAVWKVLLPAAKSGVIAAVILGVGRAIGETMAVIMVAGNQPQIPHSLLDGVRTMTANIVIEMGYATDLHREALVATAVVLFVFILIINLCVSLLRSRSSDRS